MNPRAELAKARAAADAARGALAKAASREAYLLADRRKREAEVGVLKDRLHAALAGRRGGGGGGGGSGSGRQTMTIRTPDGGGAGGEYIGVVRLVGADPADSDAEVPPGGLLDRLREGAVTAAAAREAGLAAEADDLRAGLVATYESLEDVAVRVPPVGGGGGCENGGTPGGGGTPGALLESSQLELPFALIHRQLLTAVDAHAAAVHAHLDSCGGVGEGRCDGGSGGSGGGGRAMSPASDGGVSPPGP